MKNITAVLAVLLFTACAADRGDSNSNTDNMGRDTPIANADTTTPANTLRLEPFASVPDSMYGCAEYFAYDTTRPAGDTYIFISNITRFALIRIQGNTLRLDKVPAESLSTSDSSYTAVYAGQGFKAVLKVRQTKSYDEGGFYTGTLQIIGPATDTIIPVHGESGC